MIDFLVIGGGIAGASVGARLCALGSVTLLEREEALAYHASGRSAALYEPSYGSPSTVALNEASRDFYFGEGADLLSPRGLLLVGTEETAEAFEADKTALSLHSLGMDEARAKHPILNDAVTQAAFHAEAWDIDTDRLVQMFASQIRAAGGTIRTSAEVSGIARTSTGWDVTIGGEVISARVLVNAAGAWVDVIAEMAGIAPIGIMPLRRSMARIPAPEGHDVSDWPILFGPGEEWYAKPDAGALIVSPAEEVLMPPMDAWADDMVLAEGLARYEAHVTAPVTRLLSNWAGLRSFAPDRNLVLGPDKADPSFVWMAAQGGYGFQTAPGASQLVADLVAGKPPEIEAEMVAKLSPHRFESRT